MDRRALALRIAALVVGLAIFVGVFYAAVKPWQWPAGWGCLLVLVVGSAASDLVLRWKDPELLWRRGRLGTGTKTWDKICLSLFGLLYVAILIVGAVDSALSGWSTTMPAWLWPVGAVLYLLGQAVVTWCMVVNRFFEKTARIQTDRGHQVITAGPYSVVRHPGYTATIVGYNLGTALMLLSWWALVPTALAAACLIVRTALEDRMLRDELTGYADYAARVHFRLVPGLW
jgi:protein-S-isoprenylcysteine O-methyltransferase Ste14